MAVFKCKMCGGTLEITEGSTTAVCEYCGSPQTLPRLSDDKLEHLYNRADHYRRNNEFDKAMGLYEQILNENGDDAESYWSLVLCRYGIEYVEDPTTHKRIPTVNRAQTIPFSADPDYELAIKHADLSQKIIYEQEAKAIDEILEGIFAFSRQEDAFDVFISYKETDDDTGRRTQDSLDALEIFYVNLIKKGYNVFYAPMTLKEKHIPNGKYDAFIFSALSSAKVMIVLGSKEEYFQSEWVKNEWSRYLNRIANGEKKDIIPVYRNISVAQLPEKLRAFEAFDLDKPDTLFYVMQKIEQNVNKPSPHSEHTVAAAPATATAQGNVGALLKRVSLFLEASDWSNADAYCEKVLDIDPENGEAYVGKLLATLHVSRMEDIARLRGTMENMAPYKNAIRFSDEATATKLIELNRTAKENLERHERAQQEQARIERERKQAEEQRRQEQLRISQQSKQTVITPRPNYNGSLSDSVSETPSNTMNISSVKKKSIKKPIWLFFGIITTAPPIILIISRFIDGPAFGSGSGILYWLFVGTMTGIPVQLIDYGLTGKWDKENTGWFISGIIASIVLAIFQLI